MHSKNFKEKELPEGRLNQLEQGQMFLEDSGREEKMKTSKIATPQGNRTLLAGWW